MAQGYEYQHHVVAVRYRVNGSGSLLTTLNGLEENPTEDLTDHSMSLAATRPANLLANFVNTKVQLYIRTTELNEQFHIKNITIFTKPVSSGYPQ